MKTDRTLTITLNAENASALKDFAFWTGMSDDESLNLAFQEFMELRGEDTLWDIARDPKKRARVYRRNKLTKEQIAKWNSSVEGELERNRAEIAKINAPLFESRFDNSLTTAARIHAQGLGIKLD